MVIANSIISQAPKLGHKSFKTTFQRNIRTIYATGNPIIFQQTRKIFSKKFRNKYLKTLLENDENFVLEFVYFIRFYGRFFLLFFFLVENF